MKKIDSIADLALFGARPFFLEPRPNSGLYQPDRKRFFSYTDSIFTTRQLTNNGPLARALEARLADMHGVRHCLVFCSGFMALALSIKTLALPGRSEVLMPSATYGKMTDIVRWAGLSPFYVDIDPDTLGMTFALTSPYITGRTALILAAHPVVNTCDAEGLERLSEASGVPLLIDAVEAAYGDIGGRKIGSFGCAEAFSIHASKFINGFEGGYITTNNDETARTLKRMRAFGFEGQDNIVSLGCNAKLNEMHAALALACLDEIDRSLEHNKAVYSAYERVLSRMPLRLVGYNRSNANTWRNIVVRLEDDWPFSNEETLRLLNAENMLSRAYYAPLLHTGGAGPSFASAPLPNSVKVSVTHIILPSGAHVSPDDVTAIGAFLRFLHENARSVRAALMERAS